MFGLAVACVELCNGHHPAVEAEPESRPLSPAVARHTRWMSRVSSARFDHLFLDFVFTVGIVHCLRCSFKSLRRLAAKGALSHRIQCPADVVDTVCLVCLPLTTIDPDSLVNSQIDERWKRVFLQL